MPTTPSKETETPTAPTRKRRRWKWFRRSLGGLIVALTAAILLRGLWLPGLVRSTLISQAYSRAGLLVQIDLVETDGWSYLNLRGVEVRTEQPSVFEQASIQALELRFHLLDFYSKGAAAIESIAIDQAAVVTDLAQTQPPSQSLSSEATLAEIVQDLWIALPDLQWTAVQWTDADVVFLNAKQVDFLKSAGKRSLVVDSDFLRMEGSAVLAGDSLLCSFDASHIQWNPAWSHTLTASLPANLSLEGTVKAQVQLPLNDILQTQMTADGFAFRGQQDHASWSLQGHSSSEQSSPWTSLSALSTWQGQLQLQTEDCAAFFASWGVVLPELEELPQPLAGNLQLQFADGLVEMQRLNLATEQAEVTLDGSRFSLLHEQEGWQLRVPHLEASARITETIQLASGQVLAPGSGQLQASLEAPWIVGTAPSALRVNLTSLTWSALDQELWMRQEQPAILNWENQRLTIADVHLATPAGALQFSASLPLPYPPSANHSDDSLALNLSFEEFDLRALRNLPGMPAMPVQQALLSGQVAVTGSLPAPIVTGDLRLIDCTLDAAAFPHPVPAQAQAQVRWQWQSDAFTVEQLLYQDDALQIEAHGVAGIPNSLLLHPQEWQQAFQQLQLQAQGEVTAQDKTWLAQWLPVESPFRNGVAHANFTLSGKLAELQAQVDCSATDWQPIASMAMDLPPGPYALTAALDWRDHKLTVESAEVVAHQPLLSTRGQVHFAAPPQIAFQVDTAPLALDWLQWHGQAEAHANIQGGLDALVLEGTFAGTQIGPTAPVDGEPLPPIDLEGSVTWNADGLRVHALQILGPRIKVDAQGSLGLPLQPAAWESTTFSTLPFQATIDGDIDALSWLATLPSLRRASGELDVHATASGTLSTPVWNGSLHLRNASFRSFDPALPALERLELHGYLDEQGLRFEESRGELGASPFQLHGGMQFQEDGSLLQDLTLSGEDLLLYRTSGVKVRADSELRIHGVWPLLTVSGELLFTDTRVVQRLDLLRSPVSPPRPPSPEGFTLFRLAPPLDTLQFDLRLGTKEAIQVRSNIARGRLRPELQLVGTGGVPLLVGEVFLDEVSMTLPATRLYLQPSVVRFLEDDPFHPRLNLLGRSALMGYEIQSIVTGAYDQPQVVFSSVPPLSEEDILVLLTTGQPPSDRIDRRAAAGAAALFLARDFLTTFFGSDSVDAEESLLDRLELQFGNASSQEGSQALSGRLRLKENVVSEDDSLYFEGGRDAFEDFFLGWELLLRFQ